MMVMRDRLLSKSIPRYSSTLIAAAIAGTLSSFIDGCIIGKFLGEEAMASFGIAMPFILIAVVVGGLILSSGGSICASHDIGNSNTGKAKVGFTACCLSGLFLGIISFLICYVFAKPLISLTGAADSLAEGSLRYMKGCAFGAIPTVLLTILMAYANVDGNEKHCLIAVSIMTVSDIGLDFLLGVKLQMGLFGMALATSVSYLLGTIYFLWFFLSGKSIFTFCRGNISAEIVRIIKFGYSSALNTLLISARCFFINRILMSIAGSNAVSAFSFQSNFNQFFVAIASGIGTSISVLAGIFIGESDKHKAKGVAHAGMIYGIFGSVILGIVLFSLSDILVGALMTGGSESAVYSAASLKFFGLSLPLSMVCILLIYFYQTAGNRRMANTIAILHGLVCPLLFAYILPELMGLNGVWLSTAAAELLTIGCVFLCSVLRKSKKREVGLVFLNDSAFPDDTCTFNYQEKITDRSFSSVADRYVLFLKGLGKPSHEIKALSLSFDKISKQLSDAQLTGEILDIYGCCDDHTANLNIRITGDTADRALSKMTASADTETLQHHYSANISFINWH